MQIETKKVITYRWWTDEVKEISGDNQEILDEDANDRINDMLKEGDSSGELHSVITENNKEIDMSGWWEVDTIRV